MNEDPERQREYDAALADAVGHVEHTIEAQREAEERRRGRWRLPGLAVSLVALALVLAWNGWLVVRPTQRLSDAVVEGGLRHEVSLLVEEIEAFRSSNGRLPRPEEIAPLLDEVVRYEVQNGDYVVTAGSGSVQLVYDGSVPIDAWMAETGGER